MGLISSITQIIDRRNRRSLEAARDRQLRWLMSALRRERRLRAAHAAGSECGHVMLLPVWENLADMGVTERASAFTCDACGQRFSPDEASAMGQGTEQAGA